MQQRKLLELIEAITSYSDAEEVELDIMQKRKVSAREKRMAIALSDIYRFVHGHKPECWHQNWVNDADKMYKRFVNKNLL